jgi:sulfopyruvate decarboxylase TPP-binding subunit
MINSWEAIEKFDRFRNDAIVIHGPGASGSELYSKSPSDLNLYAAMPYSASVGLGLALAMPAQKVVISEGDGSALSGLSTFATIGNMAPENLVHIVWDNGAYVTPGTMGTGQHYGAMPTATAVRADMETFARGSGYATTQIVATLNEFESVAESALRTKGPHFVLVKATKNVMPGAPMKQYGKVEQAIRFRRALIERGWIHATHAGVSKGKSLPPDERAGSVVIPNLDIPRENGPRPSLEKAKLIYSGLREAGIDFIVHLVDSANYLVQRLAAADSQITSVPVTREDEGIAIAMAAFMGGRNPAIIMEASGLGLCPLALANLGHEQHMAALIVYSHNFALGETRDSHSCTRWVADPLLEALRIPNLVVMDAADAPHLIKRAWQTVRGQKCPVAVSLPLHVLWDD